MNSQILLLKVILIFVIGCTSLPFAKKAYNGDKISIMQGAASETQTVINFVVPKKYDYRYRVTSPVGELKNVLASEKRISREAYPWMIVEIQLKNLRPRVKYQIEIDVLRNDKVVLSDFRSFKTLEAKSNYNVMIASCLSDEFNDVGNVLWDSIQKESADYYFLIGDVVYADLYNYRYTGDGADERHFWYRFMDARMAYKLFFVKELKPVVAVWDDHDMGINNGDKNFPYIKQHAKTFREFFPLLANSKRLDKGEGIGFSLKLGDHNYYFLDNRSFRSADEDKEGEHYGKAQLNWLFKSLNSRSDNSLDFIIGGDQFYGGYHSYESFQGNHPKAFASFIDKIKKLKTKVVFISGDRHLVEVMKLNPEEIGYQTYELTISGAYSKMYPGSLVRDPNPLRILGNDTDPNYSILKTKRNDKKHEVQFKAFNHHGRSIVTKEFEI